MLYEPFFAHLRQIKTYLTILNNALWKVGIYPVRLDPNEWECEKELVYQNGRIEIVCHPDMIHKKSGVIIEIKSTIRTPMQPYSNHLRQLKSYMFNDPVVHLIRLFRLSRISSAVEQSGIN